MARVWATADLSGRILLTFGLRNSRH